MLISYAALLQSWVALARQALPSASCIWQRIAKALTWPCRSAFPNWNSALKQRRKNWELGTRCCKNHLFVLKGRSWCSLFWLWASDLPLMKCWNAWFISLISDIKFVLLPMQAVQNAECELINMYCRSQWAQKRDNIVKHPTEQPCHANPSISDNYPSGNSELTLWIFSFKKT